MLQSTAERGFPPRREGATIPRHRGFATATLTLALLAASCGAGDAPPASTTAPSTTTATTAAPTAPPTTAATSTTSTTSTTTTSAPPTTTTTSTTSTTTTTTVPPTTTEPVRTASFRGITADEIHVAISMIDTPWLREMQLLTDDWGDQQLTWQALIDDLNARGGINGRRLVVDAYRYYSPVPGVGTDAEGVCLELTADHEVFAVLGGFLGPAEVSNTCITAVQGTLLVGGRQTTARLAESTAPWLVDAMMKERGMAVFLTLLDEAGLLEGRRFALVGGMDGPYGTARDLLAELGVELVLDAYNDVVVGDVEAEDARWDVLGENVRASGADTVFLVGSERAGIRNLWLQGIDVDLFVMNDETFARLSASVTPEMADGAVTLAGLTIEEIWETEGTRACADAFRAAHPDIELLGPADWVEGRQWYFGLFIYCNWLALFTMVMEAAGTNPTYASFLDAAEAMSQFSLPSSPHASFGPGKYDASDSFRLSVFDAGADEDGDLVPFGPVQDGTP